MSIRGKNNSSDDDCKGNGDLPTCESDDTSSVSNISTDSSGGHYESSIEDIDMRVPMTRLNKHYQLPSHRTEIRGPPWLRIDRYQETKVEINYESIERLRYAASDTSSSYSYISLTFTHDTEQQSIRHEYPDGNSLKADLSNGLELSHKHHHHNIL